MANASIQLKGVEELNKLLTAYPYKVALTAQKRGLTRGAARLRTYFRAEMPRATGTLRKSVGYKTVKGSKGSKVIVGLNTRFYYKTLEFGRKAHSRKGKPVAATPPMHPLGFSKVWYSQREGIAQLIIDEAKRALYQEAANIHSKTLGIARRKV